MVTRPRRLGAPRRRGAAAAAALGALLAVAAVGCDGAGGDGPTSVDTGESRFETQMRLAPRLLADPDVYAGTELDGPQMADERDRLAELARAGLAGDGQAATRFDEFTRERYLSFRNRLLECVYVARGERTDVVDFCEPYRPSGSG